MIVLKGQAGKGTVSRLNINEFCYESTLASPICLLSPTKLAEVPN